jgi:hypothetical protein
LLNRAEISSPLPVICLYISCYREQSTTVIYRSRLFALPESLDGQLITAIIIYIFIYLWYVTGMPVAQTIRVVSDVGKITEY